MKKIIAYSFVVVLYLPVVLLKWLFSTWGGFFLLVGLVSIMKYSYDNFIRWATHQETDFTEIKVILNSFQELFLEPFKEWEKVILEI